MGTIIISKGVQSVNWGTISVKSTKHEGTLSAVNAAILPKKSECSESAWQALGCLDTIWKAYIRRIQYAKDAERHTAVLNKAVHDFYTISAISPKYMAESTFRDIVVASLNLHYAKSKKTGEGMSVAMCATFKKSVLRATMRIQAGKFCLMNNVKNDTVEPIGNKQVNIKNLSDEQICALLGLDEEQWAMIKAAKAAKAC